MIKVGIAGGAGYTAGELLRILRGHPQMQLHFAYSTSNAGNPIESVHRDLIGEGLGDFSAAVKADADVVFLCLGHGHSKEFLDQHQFSDHTKIIDLSNEFRLKPQNHFGDKEFVYGLPELQKAAIKKAKQVANPGCFATAIQLALLPLASAGQLKGDVHVNAVTGATGAGVGLSPTSHFSWRDNNFSYYKAFDHQHMGEIDQSIAALQKDFDKDVLFLPNRGNFSRGIFATAYTAYEGSQEEAEALFKSFYAEAAFTFVSDAPLNLKQVVNTNKALVHVQKIKNQLLVTSIIDNLLKGASGQAVQNMNLMFGLEETTGLHLKANYF